MRYLFDEYAFDTDRRELHRAADTVSVTPQVFDLLDYLIRNRERVVSKDDLIDAIWHGRSVSDAALTTRLNAARTAIGDSGEEQRLIKTLPRKGFRFVGDVREAQAGAGPAAADNPAEPPMPALALPDKPSIAILPFTNLSSDPEQDYFADGMVEDITTALSRIKWLFVIARNSSFTYKGRGIDIRQIARELGVRYVLEGSVRKAGNRVRITGQLIEAKTGAHLWAERYDRDLADVFAVQEEITTSVASAIAPVLAEAERQHAVRKPPDSLDAWEAYHRGLWHFMKQERNENEAAKRFYQRAIDIDPNFAAGYYGLALAHTWEGWVYLSRDLGECLKAAGPLAQRAVILDGADAMAHYALSTVFTLRGDAEGSRMELEQSLALDPNHAWALGSLGCVCGFNGGPEQASQLIDKAMKASPHDPLMWAWMLWIVCAEFYSGNDEAAVRAAERMIRFRPDKPNPYRFRAAALGHLGRITEAKAALQEAMAFSKDFQVYGRHPRPAWLRPQDHARFVEGLRKAGLAD